MRIESVNSHLKERGLCLKSENFGSLVPETEDNFYTLLRRHGPLLMLSLYDSYVLSCVLYGVRPQGFLCAYGVPHV